MLTKLKILYKKYMVKFASPLDNKLDDIEGHNFFLEILMEIKAITILYSSYIYIKR